MQNRCLECKSKNTFCRFIQKDLYFIRDICIICMRHKTSYNINIISKK